MANVHGLTAMATTDCATEVEARTRRTGGDESSLVVESGVKPPHSKTELLLDWLGLT